MLNELCATTCTGKTRINLRKKPPHLPAMKLDSKFRDRYGPWSLVTGASAGIGEQFSRLLAGAGLNVVLVARRKERLNEIAEVLEKEFKVQTRVVVADLSDVNAAEHIASEVEDLEIGLLINNAGVEAIGSFFSDPVDKHMKLMAINVNSPIALARLLGEPMRKRERGGIMFLSSMAAHDMPYFAIYASSKSCVTTFSNLLRYEMKPAGVDVICIEPGVVRSEMNQRANQDIDFTKMGFPPMNADEAAKSSLMQLGHTHVFTPGFFNRIMKFFMLLLPTQLRIVLLGPIIKNALAPEQQRLLA